MDYITNKPFKIKSFLSFNLAITKICVAMRLLEDGTRMGGIQFQLSLSSDFIFMTLYIVTTARQGGFLNLYV